MDIDIHLCPLQVSLSRERGLLSMLQSSSLLEAQGRVTVGFRRRKSTAQVLHPGQGRAGLATPPSELASLDLNNHRGWFCEQGHRGFKGEKGEPGLPGLDGLDAPCPLVWHHPSLPAWPLWASPRVWSCLRASHHPPPPPAPSIQSPLPPLLSVDTKGPLPWLALGAPAAPALACKACQDAFLASSYSCLTSPSP